ncbi:MAG TPA: diaminopimelate decarboxylase [Bryobacteraceae bacterium]|nr:diaminopimelate decarboxylase [Bryobacteraceae bacterium]
MSFEYRADVLHCENVDLRAIALEAGTPCYVYSASGILQRYQAYCRALQSVPHRICYAVKANSNLSVLRLLADHGAGFDIVSGGELFRVLQAGGAPESIVFSGVGKTAAEIEYALKSGIHTFNCESPAELETISAIAAGLGTVARIALRVNPDVDAATHPYISTGMSEHKFGIDISEVEGVYRMAATLPGLVPEGVSCHIGSQILDADPLLEAVDKMLSLVDRLRESGIPIRHLDLGGGLGVRYKPHEQPPPISEVAGAVASRVAGRGLQLMLEPGRSIVAEAGVLLTRVLYRKRTSRKEFMVVDAAMNDLIRPALYKSWHDVVPVERNDHRSLVTADVVGPICETGDFLARDREMPEAQAGDLLSIATAGAYGFTQASNYNSRPRASEVLVEGSSWRFARQRESYEDLIRGE